MLAGVSVRILHYYDQIGLLKPASVSRNGYRHYEEKELLLLQQILFFRELDFPLEEVKKIITSKTFDMEKALRDHRNMITLKKDRLTKLVRTIDKTIKKVNNEILMEDKTLYDSFDDAGVEEYAEESKQRWGHTDAYKESQKRVACMTKAEMSHIKEDGEKLTAALAQSMPKGCTHSDVQELILQHYNGLKTFYEPSLEMYRGLGEMYVADPRFTAYYDKYADGLAVFMRDAMNYFADMQEGKK